jgi:hypothetical protein
MQVSSSFGTGRLNNGRGLASALAVRTRKQRNATADKNGADLGGQRLDVGDTCGRRRRRELRWSSPRRREHSPFPSTFPLSTSTHTISRPTTWRTQCERFCGQPRRSRSHSRRATRMPRTRAHIVCSRSSRMSTPAASRAGASSCFLTPHLADGRLVIACSFCGPHGAIPTRRRHAHSRRSPCSPPCRSRAHSSWPWRSSGVVHLTFARGLALLVQVHISLISSFIVRMLMRTQSGSLRLNPRSRVTRSRTRTRMRRPATSTRGARTRQ